VAQYPRLEKAGTSSNNEGDMMKTTLLSGLISVWLGLTVSGLNAVAGNKVQAGGDGEFKSLIDKYYAAWSSMNTDNAAPLYAKDADLVFYDIAPLKYNGWQEYAPGVKKNFFDNATSARLTANDDLKVTRRGNIAWTSVTFHIAVRLKNGQNLDLDGRHTAIWEKRNGKWLIVHEHVSAPLAG
jgi:ketosteroid isomerase-like protein